jgi:hypothetical protein
MRRDRRRAVLESALFSPELSYAEKVVMVVVATIRPEYANGKRRHGSKAMGPDGKFSLHLDYLARATTKSTGAVKKVLRSLAAQGHLDLVHEGTYGRPSTWQALVVRGAKNGRLTGGENGTPYGLADWLVRGAETAPLTYWTPDRRNPAPADCVTGESQLEVDAATEDTCRWHGFASCPPDCADHSTTRRSA